MKKETDIKFCTKCNKILRDDDRFCKFCGNKTITMSYEKLKKDERIFISEILYGPPYSVKYVCSNCGKVHIEHGLGSPKMKYCTNCGVKFNLCNENINTTRKRKIKYCKKCHEFFETEDGICEHCGSELVSKPMPSWLKK